MPKPMENIARQRRACRGRAPGSERLLQGEEVGNVEGWSCRHGWGTSAIPVSIMGFLGWGLWDTGGFPSEGSWPSSLKCPFLPRGFWSLWLLQGWQISWGRSRRALVPGPRSRAWMWLCRAVGRPKSSASPATRTRCVRGLLHGMHLVFLGLECLY